MGPRLRISGLGLLVALGVLVLVAPAVAPAGAATPEWSIPTYGGTEFEAQFYNDTGKDVDEVRFDSSHNNPITNADFEGGQCKIVTGTAFCYAAPAIPPGGGVRFTVHTATGVQRGDQFDACTQAQGSTPVCKTIFVGGAGTPTPPQKTEKVIFGLREHSHQVVKDKSGRAVGFLLTNSVGAGSLTVASPPSRVETAVKATGKIVFRQSLFSPKDVLILDEDKLSFRVKGGTFYYAGTAGATGYSVVILNLVLSKSVVVADRSGHKKECRAGSRGAVSLADGSPVDKPDRLEISGCGVHEGFESGVKHATVQIEVIQPNPPA